MMIKVKNLSSDRPRVIWVSQAGICPGFIRQTIIEIENQGWNTEEQRADSLNWEAREIHGGTRSLLPVFIACDKEAVRAVSRLKKKADWISCVGFSSFPSEATIGVVLESTYDGLLENRWTLGVGYWEEGGRALILTAERGIKPVNNANDFPGVFGDLLRSRLNQRHHRTEHKKIGAFPNALTKDVDLFFAFTKRWAEWALFPAYQIGPSRHPGAEFGFVAKRTSLGTLVTARGSNKEDPKEEDVALLESIDKQGVLRVVSTKRKASLNAPLAHQIFAACPEINWVIHSHVFLPKGITVPLLTTPGTEGDWDGIKAAVLGGARIINQPLHGVLILLKSADDLLPLLLQNNLYHNQSHLYDLAYSRFQGEKNQKTHFERVIAGLLERRSLPGEGRVLDLCCGTGASTLALQNMGFKRVDFGDGSTSMLQEAQKRLGRSGFSAPLNNLKVIRDEVYELITLRQAFNYIPPEHRDQILSEIARKIVFGGKIAFNTFSELPPGRTLPRQVEQQTEGALIQTLEMNTVTELKVLHTQRTEIINFPEGRWEPVFDVNEFFQHRASDIEASLRQVGFDVELHHERNSMTFVGTKKR